jgi:hypothetical protein
MSTSACNRKDTKVRQLPDTMVPVISAAVQEPIVHVPQVAGRIIGALELCCRRDEMVLMQNKRVDWDTHTIGIRGETAKDKENRRIPFDPNGRLAAILKRRGKLGPNAYVFGTDNGEFVANFKTAWESLLLLANGHDTKRAKPGARVDRRKASRGALRDGDGQKGVRGEESGKLDRRHSEGQSTVHHDHPAAFAASSRPHHPEGIGKGARAAISVGERPRVCTE